MPKFKSSPIKFTRQKEVSQPKKESKKNKNLKFFKSIQKAQQIQDSQYLLKLAIPKSSKQKNDIKSDEMNKKDVKQNEVRKSKAQKYCITSKKTASDEQSTHANGLFQSGEIYQNFIHKNKQQQKANIKKQPSQDSYLKPKQTPIKQSRQSFQFMLQRFKQLQKKHDLQTKQFMQISTAEQIHRLQKIHSIQKQQILQKISKFQRQFKNNQQSKYNLSKNRPIYVNKDKHKK